MNKWPPTMNWHFNVCQLNPHKTWENLKMNSRNKTTTTTKNLTQLLALFAGSSFKRGLNDSAVLATSLPHADSKLQLPGLQAQIVLTLLGGSVTEYLNWVCGSGCFYPSLGLGGKWLRPWCSSLPPTPRAWAGNGIGLLGVHRQESMADSCRHTQRYFQDAQCSHDIFSNYSDEKGYVLHAPSQS